MKRETCITVRTVLMTALIAFLITAVCFVLNTENSYAAAGTANWTIQKNSAGQITSVKLDMSSISGYSSYHVIIKKDDKQIVQKNVSSSVYDATDDILQYDSGVFKAEGMAYKSGAFTDFETEADLKFFTLTIDKQGHGNSVKINHIIDKTSVKTAVKNAYISTFDAGDDGMLMRYFENGDAFMGVALHPLSNYSDIDALKGEACYMLPGGSGQNYTLGGDVKLYDIWFKVINSVELTVQPPACGVTTSISKSSGEWNWDSQTNTPSVTIPSGKGYHYSSSAGAPGSWWISSVDNDSEPFSGKFTGEDTYAFQTCVYSDFGYVFPTDNDSAALTVKVNGKEIPRTDAYNGMQPYSFAVISDGTVPLNIDGTVTAEHMEETDAAVAPGCTSDGYTEGSHCSGCGKVLKTQSVIPGGHIEVPTQGQPATLTEDGMSGGTHCERCGEEMSGPVPISHPAEFTLTPASYVFSGSAKKPAVTVTDAEGKEIEPSNYTVSYAKNTNAGTASVTVTFDGFNYEGSKTINFNIRKAANSLAVNGKTTTVKSKALKKKAQVLAVSKILSFPKKGQGKMTYAKASGNKKITINKTTGKVTIKKGLKKGTYKIKVKVTAAGTGNYNKVTKTATVIIKVK